MRSGSACFTHVSRCDGLPGSARESPPLTGRSGTQRARRLRSRRTVGTSAPWPSSLPSDLLAMERVTGIEPALSAWESVPSGLLHGLTCKAACP
jgi:hypothetical protein